MERVRPYQMCLGIRRIWSTFNSLAQAAISPRQSWFGSSSPVPVWSCAGTSQTLLPKCGPLPGQGVSLPACLPHLWLCIPDLLLGMGLLLLAKCRYALAVALGLVFSWVSSWVWLNTWLKHAEELGIGRDGALGPPAQRKGSSVSRSPLGTVLMLLHSLQM